MIFHVYMANGTNVSIEADRIHALDDRTDFLNRVEGKSHGEAVATVYAHACALIVAEKAAKSSVRSRSGAPPSGETEPTQ